LKTATAKYAILFFCAVVFHLLGTWSLPLIDRDEPRFAEASREMIERGDYVVPYFNNQVRLDKPPLTYWAQTASYFFFGPNDFAARFPSAVAAALTALSIFAWGSRLHIDTASQAQIDGARLGWWAAIIFSLSLQTFLHAKAAVADMWLVLFMTIAHWAGFELWASSSPAAARPAVAPYHRRWWLTFYLALALGFLAKGPIALTPLLTVGSTICFARDLQLNQRFKFGRGILLTLAIIALWAIPALIRTHGQFLVIGIGRHVIGRSLVTMEGHGASSFGIYLLLLPFYFVTLFISFFPWSIKIPSLTARLWQRRDKIDNYLIAGVAIIFIIFTLMKTKLPHYTLPAFPLLALLLARHWQGAALSPAPTLPANAERFREQRGRSLFTGIAITAACIWIAIALVIPPLVARFFPAHELFQESRTYLQPNMQLASVEFREPSLVWYFRSQLNSFLVPLNSRRAGEFMAEPGSRLVVVPTALAGTVFANHPATWKFFSMRGFNIAKGKHVDLTLVLKPD
jgi:4-amino-4-deoxy-L-arabinose transferase-like glycosyltransferase